MPTSLFRHRNARDLIERIKDISPDVDNKIYVFLSRNEPWEMDNRPPLVDTSQSYHYEIWDQMSLLRRVMPNDIEYGIRNIPWRSGTVYTPYDDTVDLLDKNFYVITPDNNLYICIDNNGGSPSTSQPILRDESIEETADGYRWKYILNISNSLTDKFFFGGKRNELFIGGWIPIEESSITKEIAIPGTINRIVIEDGGEGYEENRTVENDNPLLVFIEGDGDQYGTATVNINTVQNSIASIEINDPGDGYINSIEVNDPGDGYDHGPGVPIPVAIRQSGENGTVQTAYGVAITNLDGGIESIDIHIRGNGYQDGIAEVIQSSAEAYAETDENGTVVNAKMTINKYGANFHKARAIVLTKQLEEIESVAKLRLVLSPRDGYGYRQFQDLFAIYALFAIRIEPFALLDSISFEDFRITGLIDSPLSREFITIDLDDPDTVGSGSIEDDVILDTQTRTFGTTTQQQIASFNSVNISSAKVLIQASSEGDSHITELLITHDGTSVFTTEYGKLTTGNELFSIDVVMTSDGIIRILTTGASNNQTNYVTYLTLIRLYEGQNEGNIIVTENLKVLDSLIGDPKYRLTIDDEHTGFEEGEDIIGTNSGAVGLSISKFQNNILRYMPDTSLYSENVNEFQPGEVVRGSKSGAQANVVEVNKSDVIRYSGDILHINNIRPIIIDPQQNILITFALKF